MNKIEFIDFLRKKITEGEENISIIDQFQLVDTHYYANATIYKYNKEEENNALNKLLKWQQVVLRILSTFYNSENNIEYKSFKDTIIKYKKGFNLKDELINEYRSGISVIEGIVEIPELLSESSSVGRIKNISISKNVFIVHGHNESVRTKVELFFRSIGYNPIVLFKEPSKGKTIIEKIEENTDDICFAIVLYTACDLGKAKDEVEFRSRARQNVVYEHGYLSAKLGREKVVALVEDGVEQPGDINGIVYICIDEYGMWQKKVADEMIANGLDLDYSKIKFEK